ncbi:MAG: MerR family transcriptional regulator [Lacibacter sp.]
MTKFTQIAFDFEEPPKKPEPKPVEAAIHPTPKTTLPSKPKSKRGRKSLKEMISDSKMIELPDDAELNQKLYYSIGEVCALFKINASSLRYWETEFSMIKPRKNKKGDRFYNAETIKVLQLIYFLLRQRKYTIEGAKDYLKKYKDEAAIRYDLIKRLQQLQSFLHTVKADL